MKQSTIEEIVKKSVFRTMKKLASHDVAAADMTEFALEIIKNVPGGGGPQRMAELVWETYQDAPEGSMNRSRLLQSIIQMYQRLSEQGQNERIEDMNDEDLQMYAVPLLASLLEGEDDSGSDHP